MLSDEVLEKVTERITNRIEQQNLYILKQIGQMIAKIGNLTPTKARQLEQILKYGGDYQKILNKIAQITKLNIKDIQKIFEEVAKNDYQFAKKFYDYRDKKFIPYNKNGELKRQVQAITNQMIDDYLAKTKAIGFTITDLNGNQTFKPLQKAYNEMIDTAIFSVSQGKTTFDDEMYRLIKQFGSSGIKTFDYQSGRSVRLDSSIRMIMRDSLRQLHNEEQKLFGEQFDSDGVEISVHLNPAPDHELVQGRQFSNDEFNKFQNDLDSITYDGIQFPSEHDGHDRRSISEYNCYHYTFAIILGVSEPEYSNEELQQIIDDNKKGFEFEGKHYTNYEGTQLQRKFERQVRAEKDMQIMAREGNNDQLVQECQNNISILTSKYKQLNQASNLPSKMKRMRVSGYKHINFGRVSEIDKQKNDQLSTPITNTAQLFDQEELFNMYVGDLSNNNIDVDSSIMLVDEDIRNKQLEQLYNLSEKYPIDRFDKRHLSVKCGKMYKSSFIGEASMSKKYLGLSEKYYKDKNVLRESEQRCARLKWNYKTLKDEDIDIYTVTHEYGHHIEYEYFKSVEQKYNQTGRTFDKKVVDKELKDTLVSRAIRISTENGDAMTVSEFKEKYFSGYAKSKRNNEWFAELFTQSQLGEKTPFVEALLEWLEVFYK